MRSGPCRNSHDTTGRRIFPPGKTRNDPHVDTEMRRDVLGRAGGQPLRQRQVVIVIGTENFEQSHGAIAIITNEIPFAAWHIGHHAGAQGCVALTAPFGQAGKLSLTVEAYLPDRRIEMPVQIGTAVRLDLNQGGRQGIRVAENIGFNHAQTAPAGTLRLLSREAMVETGMGERLPGEIRHRIPPCLRLTPPYERDNTGLFSLMAMKPG